MRVTSFYGIRTILRALVLRDTEAWHSVGAMFAIGEGLPKSERAAIWSYTRGARQANVHCQYDLGFMMILGQLANLSIRVIHGWLRDDRALWMLSRRSWRPVLAPSS